MTRRRARTLESQAVPPNASRPVLALVQQPPDLGEFGSRVLAVGEKYGYDAQHAAQVASLARQLFAELGEVHGLPPQWLGPLEHAALLHDIGYFINPKGHHRHSRYLIRRDVLLAEYPEPWREFVALLAANHRKKPLRAPKAWEPRRRNASVVLAAILRLADGLDYGHDSLARLERVRVGASSVRLEVAGIRLGGLGPVLRRKARLFTQVYGRTVTFSSMPESAAPGATRPSRRRGGAPAPDRER